MRSLPESFTTKAQLLGSESLHARTSVRIRNHRVQVSQTLLAEPYKYSNSRDTSSMAVCCIRWRGMDRFRIDEFLIIDIDEFGVQIYQILQFVNSTIRKWLTKPRDPSLRAGFRRAARTLRRRLNLLEKILASTLGAFRKMSRQLAPWSHRAGRVHG